MSKIIKFDDVTIQRIFGHEAAEDEDKTRLREYYFKSNVFERMTSDLPLRILVGHKGIGKSALFTVAMHEDRDNERIAILIRPDDVEEIATEGKDMLRDIRNWKTGLLRIIHCKALNALNLKGDNIDQIEIVYGIAANFIQSIFKPLVQKYIDNDNCNKRLAESFCKNNNINVYIDDLDRGWKADPSGISRMSAMMNAVRDLTKEHPGLKFRVAVRSDVYFLVRTSDESTDKIEGSVVWHSWSNHEILAMLVKRIESYFGRTRDERMLMTMKQRDLASLLNSVIEPIFKGLGHWKNCPTYRVLMSLIRKRPRDLVKLCTLAAQDAYTNKENIIKTENWNNIFSTYSQGRLQDTINEFRSELPDIERLLLGMKPSRKERTTKEGYVYTTDTLLKKIKDIQELGKLYFYGGKVASPKELAHFMYKINFLTARKGSEGNEIIRKYFEENKYLASTVAEFGFDWEVHPAYRWALQPDNPRDIFNELQLTADDD